MLCTLPQAAFVGAMAIADLVKTTLGPKGMVRHGNSVFHRTVRSGRHGDSVNCMSRSDEHYVWDNLLQDKILQSMGRGQEVVVTNDGATILKSLYVDNPAAKVLVGEQPAHPTTLCRGEELTAPHMLLGCTSNDVKLQWSEVTGQCCLVFLLCFMPAGSGGFDGPKMHGMACDVEISLCNLDGVVQTSRRHKMRRWETALPLWWCWRGSCCGRRRNS